MYTPPRRTSRRTPRTRAGVLADETPDDFGPEHYEDDWAGRPTVDELAPTGRRQLGLQPY